MQDLENELDGAFAGVKAALQAKQRGDTSAETEGMYRDSDGAAGTAAVAIETTIGAQAQDIIVRTARGAQNCIQYLKNNHAGRATFLPLDNIRSRGPVEERLLKLPGVIGEAFDLVEFKDAYQPAVEYLLNGVLIVDNIDTARSCRVARPRACASSR